MDGRQSDVRPGDDFRAELRADCARCAGLCCVAPTFAASADFAIDKPAGQACPNLGDDCRCAIHQDLRGRGFAGCSVFDCFGAGQAVVQQTFGGRDWLRSPELAEPMFAAFSVMRQVHELLWYLAEALPLAGDRPLRTELDRVRDELVRLRHVEVEELIGLDVAGLRERVGPLLQAVSELARAEIAGRPPDGGGPARTVNGHGIGQRSTGRRGIKRRATGRRGAGGRGTSGDETSGDETSGRETGGRETNGRETNGRETSRVGARPDGGRETNGREIERRRIDWRRADLRRADLRGADLGRADLIERSLRGVDLRGANLRGAYLIGADLRGADLRLADLIGADLRATDLSGADLSTSLFLTQFQVNAARGDHTTRLPTPLRRPDHWP